MATTSASRPTTEVARPRFGGRYFQGRLARRMLWIFLASALLPVGVVSALVYRQLHQVAVAERSAQLTDAAKAAGLAAFTQIITAASEFERANGQVAKDSALLEVPAAPVPQPILDHAQLEQLDAGQMTVWWDAAADAQSGFVLLRRDPRTRALQMARLRPGPVFGFDPLDLGGSRYAVRDASGALLLATAGYPADWQKDRDRWEGASWEMFLASPFAAPSLQMTVVEPKQSGLGAYQASGGLLLMSLAAVLLTALWLAAALIRRYMGPLDELSRATRELAAFRFGNRIGVRGDDELAALGRSFNAMADRMQRQLVTLEALAGIDRVLLEAPQLEAVLGTLLPRVAELAGAAAVSVLLRDEDDPASARAYDYVNGNPALPAVRRTAVPPALHHMEEQLHSSESLAGVRAFDALRPLAARGLRTLPLRVAGQTAGWLCLAVGEGAAAVDHNLAREFAARLSVALANLRHEAALQYQANYDSLTGLPNRAMFRERLEQAVAHAAGTSGSLGLLYIDLDNLKQVNDTAGHGSGDLLLREASRRLTGAGLPGHLMARLGGDEFAVIVPAPRDPEELAGVANRLLDALQAPVAAGASSFHVGASVGIAVYPNDGASAEELLRSADIAMYRAKDVARGEAVFFAPELGRRVQARIDTEARLRKGLAEGWFELWYQPIMRGGGVHAAEALLRWAGPGEPLSPAQMIPVAEQSGLIVELGLWVVRSACQQYAYWQRRGIAPDHVSVNASALQLRRSEFRALVGAALAEQGMAPGSLQVEVTESVAADREAMSGVRELALMGVRIALDDFGTGYSSLSQLQALPFNALKIDQCFVRDLPDNAQSLHLCRTLVALAEGLGKAVIAEGVENDAQARSLAAMGCEQFQGFLYGRAEHATAFSRRLAGERETPRASWNAMAG